MYTRILVILRRFDSSRTRAAVSPRRPGTLPAMKPTSSSAMSPAVRNCPSAFGRARRPAALTSAPAATSAWARRHQGKSSTCQERFVLLHKAQHQERVQELNLVTVVPQVSFNPSTVLLVRIQRSIYLVIPFS